MQFNQLKPREFSALLGGATVARDRSRRVRSSPTKCGGLAC
jgi:hypothetical protein